MTAVSDRIIVAPQRKALSYGVVVLQLLPFIVPFYVGLLTLLLPHPGVTFHQGAIALAALAGTALFLTVCMVPWERMPSSIDSLGPLAFFLVVAVLRYGTGAERSTLTVLVLLPLAWIALRGTRTKIAFGLVLMLAFFAVPVLIVGPPQYPGGDIVRGLMWGTVAAVLAFGVHLLVTRERRRADELVVAHRHGAQLLAESTLRAEELAAQRRMVRAVLDNVQVGIVAVDARGQLTMANKMVRVLAAAPPGAGADMTADVGLAFYQVDGTTRIPHEQLPLLRALRGETVVSQEVVYDRVTGLPRWIDERASPLRNDAGEIQGAVAALADVTVLVKAERSAEIARDFLAGVLDAVTEQGIIRTDPDGTVVLFNSGAENLLGVAAGSVVGSRAITSWIDPAQLAERAAEAGLPAVTPDNPSAEPMIAVPRGGVPQTLEWTLIRPDGRRVETLISVSPTRTDDGDVSGFLAVISDITARQESDRLKDEFVAMVSHELRTPLASIIGYLEVLTDDPDADSLTSEQARYLSVVDRNARRLHRLVGDLLFTAQVDAGTVALRTAATDLAGVVHGAIESAKPRATAAGITIALQVDVELPLWSIDPDRIGQAMDNLIGNAVKFTPRGGNICVRLTTSGPDAVIEVSDTGIGISAADRAGIFQRFYRASKVTEAAIPGLGLGLAISLAIAQAHGGQLTLAESTEPTGATFVLRLPARPSPVELADT